MTFPNPPGSPDECGPSMIERRPLKCPGVGRDKDNLHALQFYFSRPVTDDEMRFLHDVMKRAAACMPGILKQMEGPL